MASHTRWRPPAPAPAPAPAPSPEEGFSLGNLFDFSGDVTKEKVKSAVADVKNSGQVNSEQEEAMIKQANSTIKSLKGALKSSR